MAVDLTLMPVMGDFTCAHEMVSVRDYDKYDAIDALESSKLYKPINTHRADKQSADGNMIYGPTLDDPYGKRIEHVSAGDLHGVGLDCSAGAFISKLNPDTRILLYWH